MAVMAMTTPSEVMLASLRHFLEARSFPEAFFSTFLAFFFGWMTAAFFDF